MFFNISWGIPANKNRANMREVLPLGVALRVNGDATRPHDGLPKGRFL